MAGDLGYLRRREHRRGAWLVQFCIFFSCQCEASSEVAPSQHNTKPSLSLSLPVREKLVTLVSLVLQDHQEKRYGMLLHSPALGSELQELQICSYVYKT